MTERLQESLGTAKWGLMYMKEKKMANTVYAGRYANASINSEVRIYNNRLRREKIVKRQRRILALIVGVILGIIIMLVSTLVLHAQSDDAAIDYKYYTQVEVKSGDSLWAYAGEYAAEDHYKDYNSYISEVRSINHMAEDEDVQAGTTIILPYYSPEFK